MSPARRRDLERHRARAEAARRAIQKKQRRRRRTVAVVASVVVAAMLFALFTAGDDGETNVATGGSTSTSTTTAPSEPFTYGTAACPPAAKPAEKPRTFAAAPQRCIEDGVDYGAVVTTSEGVFTVDLFEDQAPGTVNNFVVLARWGWFDGDDFHRVVPGFVLQAGDPFGDPPGSGEIGYTILDELPPSLDSYVPGALAMANRGLDTNSSQFFVCVDCTRLPGPNYSLFGLVVDGLTTVEAIEALGVNDGPPSRPVTISSVEITER